MSATPYYIGALIIGAAVWAYWTAIQPRPFEPERQHGRIAYVIDGDTLKIEGVKPRIRLFGVDAPEKGERGAQEATDALKRYAPKGRAVSFVQMDTDRHGRIVARVYAGSNEINAQMIQSGAASEFCRYSKGLYGNCG